MRELHEDNGHPDQDGDDDEHGHQRGREACQAAVEKGYDVRIFGYGEGVLLVKDGQEPKRFPNVGAEAKELVEKRNVEVSVCNTCCAARGLRRGEEIPGMKVGSLTNDLSRYEAEGERMVTIAR